MPKVYSDISNNEEPDPMQPQQEVRTFTVGDPSMDPHQGQPPPANPQFNPHYAQQNPHPAQGPMQMSYEDAVNFRNQKMQEVQTNSGLSRKRAEYLIGSGRLYIDVPIKEDGKEITFTLRSLKGKEMRKLNAQSQALARAQDPDLAFMIRATTLKFALFAIDGSDADMVLGIDGLPEDQRERAREEFIDDLDENVLSKLIHQYNKMINERGFKVTTQAQAKEVSEDIKKSS